MCLCGNLGILKERVIDKKHIERTCRIFAFLKKKLHIYFIYIRLKFNHITQCNSLIIS